jgi:phosphoglycerate dehydrogenase-like enzyme
MANDGLSQRVWTPLFRAELERLGTLRIEQDTGAWDDTRVAELARQHDILVINWGARRLPDCLAESPGRLKYVCNMSGEIRPYVSRRFIEAGIAVTNWGDHPAFGVAEGALTLLLAVLKQIVPHREAIRQGMWKDPGQDWRGSVRDLRIGVYGLGVIGRRFIEFIRPLQPRPCAYDPFQQDWPQGVQRAPSLEDLFDRVEAVVITTALTDATRRSVTAEHLARLPDGGIVVNVARGAIIDQPALFAELGTGRLRAGLDVLDSDGADWIAPDHPARQWPNLLLTAHALASSEWNTRLYGADSLTRLQRVGLDNIARFAAGKPLHFTFDTIRYDRST